MCGKAPKPPPPVVQRDPVAEQAASEAQAQQAANADTAARKRRRMFSAGYAGAQRMSLLGGNGSPQPNKTLLPQATPTGG